MMTFMKERETQSQKCIEVRRMPTDLVLVFSNGSSFSEENHPTKEGKKLETLGGERENAEPNRRSRGGMWANSK